jgi:hypothetical protein
MPSMGERDGTRILGIKDATWPLYRILDLNFD